MSEVRSVGYEEDGKRRRHSKAKFRARCWSAVECDLVFAHNIIIVEALRCDDAAETRGKFRFHHHLTPDICESGPGMVATILVPNSVAGMWAAEGGGPRPA